MTYAESLDWLYGLQVYGIRLGLDNVRHLCVALGVETAGNFIHVAGTNGKGSVCAMAAAMLCASGKRTGLYTSPHLVSFRERIRLGRNLIPEEHVASGLSDIRDASAGLQQAPTFFEVATVLALAWFQRQNADWVVLETGLGGRLDATNIVTPAVSVITPIAFDHTKYLGDTLTEIAGEKAGIIKAGVPVVSAPQPPEAEAVIRETCVRLGCAVKFVSKPISDCEMMLVGSHQRMNAAVAFAAVVSAGLRPVPQTIDEALRVVEWPGRFQRVEDGRIILDGAHNPHAARQLAHTWREEFGDEKATLILGAMADKDVAGVIAELSPIAATIRCVRVNNPRSLSAADLAELAHGTAYETLSDALDNLPAERVLIAGSLFLIGEALAHFRLAERDGYTTAQ